MSFVTCSLTRALSQCLAHTQQLFVRPNICAEGLHLHAFHMCIFMNSHSMILYVYLHLLQLLRGNVGLFFTNQPRDDVISWFQSYSQLDHARTGCQATDDVILCEGPLEQFPHSMEPHLRNLGLPTTLKKGIHVHVHVCVFCTMSS